MAAGQTAINRGTTANPHRPVKDGGITVDWSLLATEARDFAQRYVYDLIRGLDETTRRDVQRIVAQWIESGAGLDELKAALREVFSDKARAALIAQTESTRAYAEGSLERYRRADVQLIKWNTVRSGDVCVICEELGKQPPAPINVGFRASSGNSTPPNHPGCRCWVSPYIPDEEVA
jgi:SPP1 gp7 family putative phage head morphogenesis protein